MLYFSYLSVLAILHCLASQLAGVLMPICYGFWIMITCNFLDFSNLGVVVLMPIMLRIMFFVSCVALWPLNPMPKNLDEMFGSIS